MVSKQIGEGFNGLACCNSCKRPCTETLWECPEHGVDCEPDDHVEPPTVNGELI